MDKVDKLEVADEYFEMAIECFLDREKYASSIHLAGAAQEIYGKWIRCNGGKEFNAQMLDVAEQIHKDSEVDFNRKQLNKAERGPKNSLKHLNNKDDRFTDIDLKLEAISLLGETMIDHCNAGRSNTSSIDRFKNYLKPIGENLAQK